MMLQARLTAKSVTADTNAAAMTAAVMAETFHRQGLLLNLLMLMLMMQL